MSSFPMVSIAKLLSPDVPQSHVEQSGYVIIGKLNDGNLNFLILLNKIVIPAIKTPLSIILPIVGATSNNVAPKVKVDLIKAFVRSISNQYILVAAYAASDINIKGAKLFHKNLTIWYNIISKQQIITNILNKI